MMESTNSYLPDHDETKIFSMNEQTTIENRDEGLSVGMTALFIVGAMCGSGMLALPLAIVQAGWSGIGLLIICGCISAFTGNILGKCWMVILQRYPQYAEEGYITDPYPTIAYLAAGQWAQTMTRISIMVTAFGGGTVFLLIIAGNCSNLLESLGRFDISPCYWILIVGAFLIPLSFLGTPKDFWWTGMIASATTALGAVFVVASLSKDPQRQGVVLHSNPTFDSFFNAFGTVLFAFGGAAVFPTIQVDMKNPNKFPLAVVIGILSVLSIYIPVAVTGFVQLGDQMTKSNILDELAKDWLLYSVIILITVHLFMAFMIVLSPIYQDLEGFLNIPNKFSVKRCLLRTAVVALILFVALSVPHFGIILSLVGGTTITLLTFVFPPLFYMLLARQKPRTPARRDQPGMLSGDSPGTHCQKDGVLYTRVEETGTEQPVTESWLTFEIPLHVKIFLIEIMAVGVFGGISSIYSVAMSLADGSSGFTVPCYVNISAT